MIQRTLSGVLKLENPEDIPVPVIQQDRKEKEKMEAKIDEEGVRKQGSTKEEGPKEPHHNLGMIRE